MYPIRSLYIEVIEYVHDMLGTSQTLQDVYLSISSITMILRYADINSDISPFSVIICIIISGYSDNQ